MLAYRLTRGSHPAVLLRRLLLACAAGGVGFLLLSALAYAVARPSGAASAIPRLLWCAVPLVATVQLAVVVARAEPSGRPPSGLDVAGMGPARVPALAAVSAAAAGLLGSGAAWGLFLLLRGDLTSLPFHGAAADLLSAGGPLPLGATVTLLAVAPVAAAAATALTLHARPARRRTAYAVEAADFADAARAEPPLPVPTGLPWGTTLMGAGISISAYASDDPVAVPPDGWLPLGGALGGASPGMVTGWLLIAAGVVLAAPGLTHVCGLLLATGRPGVLRLLAGRGLQEEATRVGRPLGALSAACAAVLATLELDGLGELGPLGVLGAATVLLCAMGSVATAADQARSARRPATALLLRLGAPRGLLRRSAMLRTAVLLAVFLPLTWLAAQMITLPTGR
ncbi:hypothetical protein [Streptomyces sp. RFCAC02]|uniref:hypothetical protein n=1 Tax=Streptomyces sp. RFCAC02 TaxID=2499143 RepID=UPI001021E92E|nr:hypothetical protein [Streptomyces sp. RFCAC02]